MRPTNRKPKICINRHEVRTLLGKHGIENQIMPFIDALLAMGRADKNTIKLLENDNKQLMEQINKGGTK